MRQTRHLAPILGVQVRDGGAGDGSYTIKGKASVFNEPSLDLGGFTERIAPGAFENALENAPHVVAVWDHDTRFVLGSTENQTLTLSEQADGLGFWTRVAPTSYAADLRVLLERGDISQCSFAFTIDSESWLYEEGQKPVSTIERVGELFDVTICAMGAYPQTGAALNSFAGRDRLATALREGRVDGLTLEDARQRGMLPDLSGFLLEDPEPTPARPAGEDAPTSDDRAGGAERERWLAQAHAHMDSASRAI